MHLLSPVDRIVPLSPDPRGYHRGGVAEAVPGSRYLYRLDGKEKRPDPASRYRPDGVHGPSGVVDPGAFRWEGRGWRGLSLADYVLRRRRMTAELAEREPAGPAALLRELLAHPEDGRVKLYLTWKALRFRRERRELFGPGDYLPRRGPHAAGRPARWRCIFSGETVSAGEQGGQGFLPFHTLFREFPVPLLSGGPGGASPPPTEGAAAVSSTRPFW